MSMQIPSVMFIEMAKDSLLTHGTWATQSAKEFDCLGPARKKEIVDLIPGNDPMTAGYLLGFETARVLLSMMADAVKAKVNI